MSPGSSSPRFTARIPVMALFLAALSAFFSPFISAAQPPATYTRFCASCGLRDIETFSSQNGQFIVHGSSIRVRAFTPAAARSNEVALIEFEPQLVAVTAERTRSAFTQELGLPDTFQDKIHIAVLNLAPPGQPIGIISQLHTDGFAYKIGMPSRVQSVQFSKALVQTLLLELANRNVRRCAELPTWLVEGMNRQLLTRVVPASVVNSVPMTIERAGYDRLGGSKTFLHTNTLLTIQELSFPDLPRATVEQRLQFEASAHLLVHQLLRLKDGPQLMTRFVQTLPHALNWQTALFHVYDEHFDTPLRFEKWWMLNSIQFQNRENRQTWTQEITLARLESLLRTPMEYRADSNSLPEHRDAPLQELIQRADFSVQKDILGQKLQHLYFLAMNVPAPAQPIWTAYQRAIESYLQKRSLHDYQPALKSDPEQRLQVLVKSTLNGLDELDLARADFKATR